MNNFIVTANAVLPLFLLILLGIFLRKRGYMSEKTLFEVNRAAFAIFLPFLLFNNIYHTTLSAAVRPTLITFTASAVLIVWLLTTGAICAIEKTPARRGAMIQGIYRSNFALFGLPLIINLYGTSQSSVPSVMITVIIPLYNILAVITLEVFRGGKIRPGKVLFGIARNPLIIGTAAGVLAAFFGVHFPAFLDTAIGSVASVAMPLSLIVLGASLKFNKVHERVLPLALSVTGRLAVIPGLVLPCSILVGFSGVELATLIAIFASPTAISAYPMAVQMNSDGDLTAEIIVFTTLFSCITVFLWIFGLKQSGLL